MLRDLEETAMEQTTLMGSVKSEESNATKQGAKGMIAPAPTSGRAGNRRRKGLSLTRRYTQPGDDTLSGTVWERRQSVITNPDGSIVFEMRRR